MPKSDHGWVYSGAVVLALGVFLGLSLDAALSSSATYDEALYLSIGAKWWRSGATERIARMGSPMTFWRLQQGPGLWALDRAGYTGVIDDPEKHQPVLLIVARIGGLWIGGASLVITAAWARLAHGRKAMALAAWLHALSPNLIAQGALATMEMPLIACSAGMCLLMTVFLQTGSLVWLGGTALLAGLAFSCKFSAILLPPLFAIAWVIQQRIEHGRSWAGLAGRLAAGSVFFLVLMGVGNVVVTGGARLPLSEQVGEHPAAGAMLGPLGPGVSRVVLETGIPQDWAAFARQWHHQRTGGPSYFFGERRQYGWRVYYLASLGVKVPIAVLVLVAARALLIRVYPLVTGERLAVVVIGGVLAVVSIASTRNYGFRYILFLAPAAIMLVSRLGEMGRVPCLISLAGVAALGFATASCHPHELSYFNAIAGGAEGGKYILSDSNLDWGQGARALARLQEREPGLGDLTLFYFGDTDPRLYGVKGEVLIVDAHGPRRALPELEEIKTAYIGVSRSLQFGPWGPAGYFEELAGVVPAALTDDHTIAIYPAKDMAR